MGAIVESKALSATRTRYSVPGWGVGELWTSGRVVVAHDFDFVDAASVGDAPGRLRAGPPMGAVSPPSGTLAPKSSQVGNAFAPISRNGCVPGASNTADELAARVADYLAGGTTPMIDIE